MAEIPAQRSAGAPLVVFQFGARAFGIGAAHDADLRQEAVAPKLLDLVLRKELHIAPATRFASSCCCSAKIEL